MNEAIVSKTSEYFKKRGVILPKVSELSNPHSLDEDVKNKKVNLAFFGNFHKMEYEKYQWAISELLKDRDYVYSTLTKDLYYLGLVLERKYRILRWTYTIFVIGIIVSLVSFAISFDAAGETIQDVTKTIVDPNT